MLNEIDRAFIERVSSGLAAGQTFQQIADQEDMPLSTLYNRIRSLGYKTAKSLAPINAPALDNHHGAA